MKFISSRHRLISSIHATAITRPEFLARRWPDKGGGAQDNCTKFRTKCMQLKRGVLLKCSRYMSTTNASISSVVPKTEKLVKARRCRRSGFIVSRCLEPLMKYEARVVDITSQKNILNRAH